MSDQETNPNAGKWGDAMKAICDMIEAESAAAIRCNKGRGRLAGEHVIKGFGRAPA